MRNTVHPHETKNQDRERQLNELITTDNRQKQLSVFGSIDDFEAAMRMAKALSSSPLVPESYRGEGGLGSALIALELSQRMDMSALMVMQNLHVINGRPSWSAKMVVAAINACGRFSPIRYEMDGDGDAQSCRAYAYELKTDERLEGPLVSIAIAKAEGWYDRRGSKWKTMPEVMLRWRAATWWGNQYAPELLMGLPTAEESADIIDVTPTVYQQPSVDDLNASLSGKKNNKPAEYIDQDEESEWPKEIDGGWIDSRKVVFDQRVHGMSADGVPGVTESGCFRKKRGCDSRLHQELDNVLYTDTPVAVEETGQTEQRAKQETNGPVIPQDAHPADENKSHSSVNAETAEARASLNKLRTEMGITDEQLKEIFEGRFSTPNAAKDITCVRDVESDLNVIDAERKRLGWPHEDILEFLDHHLGGISKIADKMALAEVMDKLRDLPF